MPRHLAEGWYALDRGGAEWNPQKRIATGPNWHAKARELCGGDVYVGYWNGASWLHLHFLRDVEKDRALDKKRRIALSVVVGVAYLLWSSM